jgi:thiamine-phosphate pyrophosphorylase
MLEARGISLGVFAEQLRDAGVRMLQYRHKGGTVEHVLKNAAIISQIFARTDALMIMNDSPELAVRAGWKAVHVGQGDAAIEEAKAVLGAGGIVGSSTHNEEQVRMTDAAAADYVAIGPVFATSTKTDTEPVVGVEGVRMARRLTSRPLVAIGGITAGNAASVIEAGADAVAVIGALLRPGVEPGAAVRELMEATAKVPHG